MIKKLYIDNFRCLVNFQLDLHANQLWLGDNGTGKSSVIYLLGMVQRILEGASIEDMFSVKDLTLWQKKDTLTVAIVMTVDQDQYDYELTVECDRDQRRCRIGKEQLKWNGKAFFLFDGHEAHLYGVGPRMGQVEEVARFGADSGRSVLPTIAEREDNKPLIQFRRSVGNWLLVQPIPAMVEDLATKEADRLYGHGENFAAWYRHALQENPEIGYEAFDALRRVLPGFESLSLKESGDSRRLTAGFRLAGVDCRLPFGELSDGQRQLIMLYVILSSLKHTHSVLLIDEPDNFVSLREIQPWLQELQSLCEGSGDRQAIIISHHPEVINRMVDGSEVLFYRSEAGHTQTKPYAVADGLTPAETMARGWEDE